MATIEGAKAIGWENEIGSLARRRSDPDDGQILMEGRRLLTIDERAVGQEMHALCLGVITMAQEPPDRFRWFPQTAPRYAELAGMTPDRRPRGEKGSGWRERE